MKKILINDVSLKEIISNANLTFKDKLEMAKTLSSIGVDAIELPLAKEKADEVLVKTICACVNKTCIAVDGGFTLDSIEKASELVKTAKNKRLVISIPISPIQMEYFVSKKPKDVLSLIESLTLKAKSLCNDVEVCFIDVTRAEQDFLSSALKSALSAGATAITLKDCVGDLMPDAFAEFTNNLFNLVPELSNVDLYVAFNDSYSMAVALSIYAIKNNFSGIKTCAVASANYPSLEKLASAFDRILVKDGYSLSLNKNTIHTLSTQLAEITSSKQKVELINEKEDEQIGQALSESELKNLIKERGYNLSAEDVLKVYEEYLRLANKKSVSLKELDIIIATNSMQVKETYALERFSVNTSNVLNATASIVLNKDGKSLSGLSYGNGPIDAAFLAIENITGRHFELDEFELSSVTEGKGAMGHAIIKLRNNGALYSGRGVSTDIIGASIRAYLNALNKIVYEELN